MNYIINPIILDIIVIVCFVLALFIGYCRGFVKIVYSLCATILSFFIALYASSPISNIISLIKFDETDLLLYLAGDILNRVVIFFIAFVILKIIFTVVGFFIKPLITKLLYKINFIKSFDKILGFIVGGIEGLLYLYIAGLIFISPIVTYGLETMEATTISKHVLDLVPSAASFVGDMTNVYEKSQQFIVDGITYDGIDANSLTSIVNTLDTSYDSGVLSREDIVSGLEKYIDKINNMEDNIEVSTELYNKTTSLMDKVALSAEYRQIILSKMTVSE